MSDPEMPSPYIGTTLLSVLGASIGTIAAVFGASCYLKHTEILLTPEVRAVSTQKSNLEALELYRDSSRPVVPYDKLEGVDSLIRSVFEGASNQQERLDEAIAYVKEDIRTKSNARYDSLMREANNALNMGRITYFPGLGLAACSLGVSFVAPFIRRSRLRQNSGPRPAA